jgi:hypothetical protein
MHDAAACSANSSDQFKRMQSMMIGCTGCFYKLFASLFESINVG